MKKKMVVLIFKKERKKLEAGKKNPTKLGIIHMNEVNDEFIFIQ